jgi:ABC-2 type transport system ATP-binding protein
VSDVIIDIRDLSRFFPPFPAPALDHINASIPKGKMVGIAGPDGAGKTTLIRLITGLLLPSKGTITIAGFDSVKQAQEIHKFIGYMPQKFGLYEDLTVQQNLNLYADLRGVIGSERAQAFEKLLAFTGLGPFTNRLAMDLSGGMKQKLGLACALIKKPELLLLDEPSVGVDPISRRELWKMVQDLVSEGISVLWSTAYLDEAERCDAVLLLNDGKLLYQGDPLKLNARVDGRVFKMTGISNRRKVLTLTLQQENVLDAIIQGQDLRIVLRQKDHPLDITKLDAGPDAKLVPTAPRFEDAFVDILGGGHAGESLLAANTPLVKEKRNIVVEAKNLTKKFGSFVAADDITFQIHRGEIFGLLGPNGAGKSTTFKMMCGLLKPTAGQAYVNGLDLQIAPSEARSHIGYMAQKFSLYGDLSVQQNLIFFSGIYNLRGKVRSNAISQMIEIFNFQSYLDENASDLPLGFKQRLALSCAVMHRPQVLFLDEPTSGVDPITRREFWNHINGLVQKGVTVMVTTHFMDEAEYCDRIGLVYQGKIINMGTPDALKQRIASPKNPVPTLEDAFIELIKEHDAKR